MSRRLHISILLVAGAACLILPPLMLAGVGGPVRVAATLAFMCLAPGAALLALLRPARPLELGLTVATSLAVFVVASEVMLAIGRWAPATATYAIAALALPAMATRIYRESDSNLGPRQRSNHKQGGL